MITGNRLNGLVREAAEHGLYIGSSASPLADRGTPAETADAAVRSYIANATGLDVGQPENPAAVYYTASSGTFPASSVLPEGIDLSELSPDQAAVHVARAIRDGARRAREDAEEVERAAEAFLAEHDRGEG
ncbi:hypothetical protein NE857_34040 (plasmid) [Nocardiopsis exhalans]|uniref:Uncharacterized protein n=1 Tax=Nocardiopsis exhalans TaxID=163604 RepID=A0ABY5DJX1_9ACTN|nr:hypothetical protein [Nocardiopsis exhalans]USY23555.1 hypothetical protein NE857_34040 [Nocardiopsis exhalans]